MSLCTLAQVPGNDSPCINASNPPIDLTGGGAHNGTTCEALGPNDPGPLPGGVADWENQLPCNNTTEGASVWYMFTPDSTDVGYDIIVSSASISNNMAVQVYNTTNPSSLCNAVPTDDAVIASSCSDLNVELRVPVCDPSLTYFIKVTTLADDCGAFDILVTPAIVCDYANTCEEAIDSLLTITQASCADPLEYITIPGCLDLACPSDSSTCMADQGPTVWFKIIIDNPAATALITQVEADGFDVVWSVFQGTSCADMIPIANQEVIDGVTQTFPCSDSDGDNGNIFITPIDPNTIADSIVYWVAVTALGEIEDPNFEFSYNSALACLACSGDSPTDCNNGDFTASIMEDGEWTEVDDEYPFCQGMDVQVCLEFNYNTTGSGNDWLHGFVPVFGRGWDVNDNILSQISPGGSFEFFRSTGDCAPILNGYDLPNICTYMEDGILKLCNTACDSGCPCSGGMQDGDAIPSGYWWNTDGGSPTCGTFGCSPASFYGWPSATNVDVEVCFDLKTKQFDSFEECADNRSLQIIVQTFSDAVTGCWDDQNPCIIDPSIQGPSWEMVCFNSTTVTGNNAEICSNENLNILLQTSDGSTSEIQVDVIDNPNVTGENSYTFSGGSGSIVDDLLNTTTTVQVVEYVVYTVDPSLPCPGPIDTVKVTIHPELMVTFPPASVCEGDCTDITPDITGGSGDPYMYEWSTGEVTASINVCPLVSTAYFVTVTDMLGCEGVEEVEVIVRPPVEAFLPPSISVCKDDNFDPLFPDYQVCLDFVSGSSPVEVQWLTEPGLIGQSGGSSGECFNINEVASSEFSGSGVYVLTANMTDFYGCTGTVETEVIINGELTILAMVQPYDCGDTEAVITVTGHDDAGNPVTNFLLYGGCLNEGFGTFIDEFQNISGAVNIQVYLQEYTCYTIIGQTETGCQSTIEVDFSSVGASSPIELEGTTEICAGNAVTLSVVNSSDFASFEWSNNLGSTSFVSFTPDSTDTYSVTGIDADGCISSESISVIVYPEESAFCTNPCIDSQNDFQIVGTAYSDVNVNGVFDTGDAPLSNVMVTDIATNFTVFTNTLGQYIMPANEGTFNLTASNSVGNWIESSISIDNIIVDKPCIKGVDFAFEADTNVPNALITVTNSITRCDFETKFYITVENLNHESFSGEVEFLFDEEAAFFSSDITGYQLNGNIVTFETGAIMPFQQNLYTVTLKMPSGSSSLPMLDFEFELTENNTTLDDYNYAEQLKCSYDPNDKRTNPDRDGDDNLTLTEETLDYTIRFQNNGNDTAFHVRIVDELDINLDPMSIRFNSSSHPFYACIMDHTLMIDFYDILLVDSTTNYPASQGYVNFSIDTKDDLIEGTIINNTADIIFDTNDPIITNTVVNTIVTCPILPCDPVFTTEPDDLTLDCADDIVQDEPLTWTDDCDSYGMVIPTLVEDFTLCDGGTVVRTWSFADSCGNSIEHIQTITINPLPIPVFINPPADILINCDETQSFTPQILEYHNTATGSCEISGTVDPTSTGTFDLCGGSVTYNWEFTDLCDRVISHSQVITVEPLQVAAFINPPSDVTITCEEWPSFTSEILGFSNNQNGACDISGSVSATATDVEEPCGNDVTFTWEFTDECGRVITHTQVVTVEDPLATTSITKDDIQIYPNPTSNLLNVRSDYQITSFNLYTTTGKSLHQSEEGINVNNMEIDLSRYPSGLYLLQIETEKGRWIEKVVRR